MISIVLIVFSFIIDFFCSRFLTLSYYHVSFFYPCFFLLASIFSWFYIKNKKKYFTFILISYLIGCLLFQTDFLLRLISFSVVYFFLSYFWDKYHLSLVSFSIFLFLSLFFYYFTYFLFLFFLAYPGVTFPLFLVQLLHIIPFNLLVGIVLYLLLGIKYRYR